MKIIAYEPIWAIGSGTAATPADAVAMQGMIRGIVQKTFPGASIQVLYGGSVDGANAYQFLREPEVDGVLVGGASLKMHEFETIVNAGREVMIAQKV